MANSASTINPGVIVPPVPNHLLAQCVSQLGDLERWFGTAGLEKAIAAWQANGDVRARLNFLHADDDAQQTLDALNRLRQRGGTELADELEANWKAAPPRPMAEPLPPHARQEPSEQVKADCRRTFGPNLLAELAPVLTPTDEQLAEVIPFPTLTAGGAR